MCRMVSGSPELRRGDGGQVDDHQAHSGAVMDQFRPEAVGETLRRVLRAAVG
jgi:hypothetical protein